MLEDWVNISDETVHATDRSEECPLYCTLVNLRSMREVVDYDTFPAKSFLVRWVLTFFPWVYKILYPEPRRA